MRQPPPPLTKVERWARFGRRLAREACGELNKHDSVPVIVVPGDRPPTHEGEPCCWRSKRTGELVWDHRRYWRGGGWPVYHPSTRRVVVGRDWLAARLAAALDPLDDGPKASPRPSARRARR
jgi:hypothetical protein